MQNATLLALLNDATIYGYPLLQKLAEANFAVTDRTDEGDSVLHLLVESRHVRSSNFVDYLKTLVNAGADINAVNNQNVNFLSYYLEQYWRKGELDVFALVLKTANFNLNQPLADGKTLFEFIYHSQDRSSTDCMELIINHPQFNPNIKTSRHNSLLLHMISEDNYAHEEKIFSVLKNPQTKPGIKNNNDKTALGLLLSAATIKNMGLLTALIDHPESNINELDENENNYLQQAIISRNDEVTKIAQLLIAKGIDVAHKNNKGKSSFDLIFEHKAYSSDYDKNSLLINILTMHRSPLFEDYSNGKSILTKILENNIRFSPDFTHLITLYNSEESSKEALKKHVAECFHGFAQRLISKESIRALIKALIDIHADIDIEYYMALTALSDFKEQILNSNFKKIQSKLDLSTVISYLKNMTKEDSKELTTAFSNLTEFFVSPDDFNENILALEDEIYKANMRVNIKTASKMFGHLFSLSGSIPVNHAPLTLTGSFQSDTSPFMIYLMNAYLSHCMASGKHEEHLETLRQVRNMTALAVRNSVPKKNVIKNEKTLLSMINDSKNNGVEIITGWSGHLIDIIIKGDDLYRNNGGGCSTDATTEHYKITKPENITKHLFNMLQKSDLESTKVYIQKDLHSDLGLVFTSSIPGKFQTVGNCGLYNMILALKTKYRLFLPQAQETADLLFADTIKFFEQFYLENYLTLFKKDPVLPHILTRLIIQQLMPEAQLELMARLLAEHFDTEANQKILHTELLLKRWSLQLKGSSTETFENQLAILGVKFDSKNAHLQMLQRFLNNKVRDDDLEQLKSYSPEEQIFQGEHLLHIAVQNNNVELATSLLQIFPHAVNLTNWHDQEPLCLVKSVKMIEVLIQAGASLARTDYNNALDCAILAKRTDLVNSLLEYGAKLSEYSTYYAASRKIDILRSVIKYDPESVTKTTNNYSSSIHAAARAGKNENIQALIYDGGANPGATDVNGITPLQLALKHGHQNTAQFLIEYPGTLLKNTYRGDSVITTIKDEGIQHRIRFKTQERKADLEYFESTFKNSNLYIIKEDIDYLITAIRINDIRAIRGFLLAYPAIKVVDTSNHYFTTPLGDAIQQLASKEGDEYKKAFEIIEMLLKTPAININTIQLSGEPLLFWATSLGNVDVLELFLKDPKLDPNKPDTMGYTALHDAVERGHLDCVKRLLADERVDSARVNVYGKTAAELEGCSYEIREFLTAFLEHQQQSTVNFRVC